MSSSSSRIATAAGVVAALILAIGVWEHRAQRASAEAAATSELGSIAQLKVNRVAAWRAERLADAAVIADIPRIAQAVAQILVNPQGEEREALLRRFRAMSASYGYDDVLLVDTTGAVVLRLMEGTEPIHAEDREAVARAVHEAHPTFADVHRSSDGKLRVGAIAPIFRDADPSHGALGAIILAADIETRLLPLVEDWPKAGASAEALLVRREGESVAVISGVRKAGEPPLTLRFPLERGELPEVMAVRGARGPVRGRDHRGVEVVAVALPVPGSPWFLVAEEAADEAFAPARFRAAMITGGLLALVAALTAIAVLVQLRSEGTHFRALYASEKARRRTEERYRTMLMSVGDGVIATDSAGRVVTLNPTAEALTGWPLAEALGRPIEEVFHIVHEQSRERVESPVRRVLSDGQTSLLQNHTSLLARHGADLPVADSGAPILDGEGGIDGVVLVFRDQTIERAAEQALVNERNNLQAFMDSSPIALALVDSEASLVRVNPAGERLLGGSRTSLVGRQIGDLLGCANRLIDPRGCGYAPACGVCAIRDVVTRALSGGGAAHDQAVELVRDVGGRREHLSLKLTAQPMLGDGPPRTVVALWDVSVQRRAEDDRRLLEAQLIEAQKMESIARLAGGVAHDFNNLLCVILVGAELALETTDDAHPLRRDLEDIKASADRAAGLTRQLLAFSRKQVMRPEIVSLNGALSAIERIVRSALGEDVTLELALEPGLGNILVDPTQLDQVVMNLAINARDAMPDGGRLVFRTSTVALDSEQAALRTGLSPGPHVALSVTDSGFGMDEATRLRAFEPFFTTKEKGKGTGLGLATVLGIVTQSGGAISVTSAVGRGTTFEVLFPVESAPAVAASPASARTPRATVSGAVLVVEDEDAVRALAARILGSAGYAVTTAHDAAEALALCDARSEPFDLVLTDVIMPGMNGKALANRIAERWPSVPVVFMSGYTDDVVARHGVLDPGTRFVEKPFAAHLLLDAVGSALDARARA